MKIIFSAIKNSGIFEDDFMHLPEEKGTIEFKRMQTAGGIAVIYAPNGTGKTSFANLLSTEVSNENIFLMQLMNGEIESHRSQEYFM